MRESGFLKRLRKELPVWVERGWVTTGSQRQILDHAASHPGVGVRYLPLALSVLGVLLLGSGVITYFAANWNVMPKLVKLIILFGSMWVAYGAAGYWLERRTSPQLGEAMLLLGVILFGANIMLIAQIYHIDAHYPNGVLMWALGGILTAYLMHSQVAMVASITLAVLWTGMDTFGFDWSLHWPFLIVWVSCLPAIYRKRWMPAWTLAVLGFLVWSWFMFPQIIRFTRDWSTNAPVYLVQIYLLAYVGMFVFGLVIATYRNLESFSGVVQRSSVFAGLASFYAMTFPDLHRGLEWRIGGNGLRLAAQGPWIIATLVALAAVIGLAVWQRTRTTGMERPAYLNWGDGLLALVIALNLANLFVTGKHGGTVAIVFNLVFLAGLVWLIYAGMRTNDRFLVNMAFLFFSLGMLSRYFDTFWTLLDRSYFFMGAGLLLIGGGYFLEKQRRKLISRIRTVRAEGGRP